MKIRRVLLLLLSGVCTGVIWHWMWWFPFPQLAELRAQSSWDIVACPSVDATKLREVRDILEHTRVEDLFWGDSVVEGMHDSRLYGFDSLVDIGHHAQILQCSMAEVPYIIGANPRRILIYLGGNDVDGSSGYGPEVAVAYYCSILDSFLQEGIEPIVHQIHGASLDRDREYLAAFNNGIGKCARDAGLQVIPPLEALSFERNVDRIGRLESPYTYDGEHLKPEGYRLWADHILSHVPDFGVELSL